MRKVLIGLGLYASLVNGAFALSRVDVVNACADEMVAEFGSDYEDYYSVGATAYVEFKVNSQGKEFAQLLTGNIFCWVSEDEELGEISTTIVALP